MRSPVLPPFRLFGRPVAMVLVAALSAALFWPGAASADAIAEKKAEAERLASALDEHTARVSMLTEDLNAARVVADRTIAALADAEASVARAKEAVAAMDARLTRQAVDAYVQGGGVRSVEVLLGDGEQLARLPVRAAYARTATAHAFDTLDALRAERARLQEEETRLVEAAAASQQAIDAVEARHRAARAAVGQHDATLAEVEGELAELVAAEERRRAEEEAGRVQAEMAARQRAAAEREAAREAARRQQAPAQPEPSEPTASGARAAVEEAKRQLGKPYEYGADGPDSFDCSGLTQWAWKAGGKYLPHSSRAQYAATSRVSLANIQLGDLLFFGPSVSGIHHVGIYAGDGQMIEASRTGTPVRYASIYRRDMVGIGRVN